MAAKEIAEGVYWVGAIDYDRRQFHGLTTPRGTTYNAYLVVGEKVALVDSVDGRFTDELLLNLRQVIDPGRIDYIVSNHAEPDHSGAIPEVLRLAPSAPVYATARGVEMLRGNYHSEWDLRPVTDGDTLDLGGLQLRFVEAPFLHWPDTMFTYLPQRRLLFTCDFLSTHVASPHRFDDQIDDFMMEAGKYYAYIMRPFARHVLRGLDKMAALQPALVAPSHGPVLRRRFTELAEAWRQWSNGGQREQVTIIYASIWDSTETLARALADALVAEGLGVRLFNLRASDRAEMLLSAIESAALLLGSLTVAGGPYPDFYTFLPLLKGLRLSGRLGAVFGSYGWGGGAVKSISAALKEAGLEVVEAGLEVKLSPGGAELARCQGFARQVAARVKAKGQRPSEASG